MRIVGFTGTKNGMTQRQRATFRYLLAELEVSTLHHGDCIGADAQAHRTAKDFQIYVVRHPPTNHKYWANCVDADETRKEFAYLTRNRHIINEGIDGLFATPKDSQPPENKRGQGTWTTVSYAEQVHRRIWLILPDGTFRDSVGGTPPTKLTMVERVNMADDLCIQDMRAAQFRAQRRAEGAKECHACRSMNCRVKHLLCLRCFRRLPGNLRKSLENPADLELALDYLRFKLNCFKWIDEHNLMTRHGMRILITTRKGERICILINTLNIEIMTRKRLADIFKYFEETVMHNRFASKMLIR